MYGLGALPFQVKSLIQLLTVCIQEFNQAKMKTIFSIYDWKSSWKWEKTIFNLCLIESLDVKPMDSVVIEKKST